MSELTDHHTPTASTKSTPSIKYTNVRGVTIENNTVLINLADMETLEVVKILEETRSKILNSLVRVEKPYTNTDSWYLSSLIENEKALKLLEFQERKSNYSRIQKEHRTVDYNETELVDNAYGLIKQGLSHQGILKYRTDDPNYATKKGIPSSLVEISLYNLIPQISYYILEVFRGTQTGAAQAIPAYDPEKYIKIGNGTQTAYNDIMYHYLTSHNKHYFYTLLAKLDDMTDTLASNINANHQDINNIGNIIKPIQIYTNVDFSPSLIKRPILQNIPINSPLYSDGQALHPNLEEKYTFSPRFEIKNEFSLLSAYLKSAMIPLLTAICRAVNRSPGKGIVHRSINNLKLIIEVSDERLTEINNLNIILNNNITLQPSLRILSGEAKLYNNNSQQ